MTDHEISVGEPFKFSFSELQWAAVVATFPIPVAVNAEIDEERKGFELIASACLNLTHHHRLRSANGFPTKRWQKRREQIADDIAEAEKDGASDELPALREALRRADAAVKGFGLLGRAHQGGKRDAAREWLYLAALAMWTRLGGRPTVSRRRFGTAPASGPMIDFMIAMLTPVLHDKTPGAEALAKFLKRKRKAENAREARKLRRAANAA